MDEQVSAIDAQKANVVINTSNSWQRLSPIAILYFVVSIVRVLVGQFVYIIPPVILGYNSIKENPLIGIPLAVGLLLLLVTGSVLSFYFFQYRLHKGSIEIRSGVFQKKHVNLPFSRIQNVKIEQPIYYRWAKFACLQLDTAGSAKQEAKVVALKLDFAEELKKEILAQHEDDVEPATSTNDENLESSLPAGETLLNTRSLKDLVIHGVTSNRIWIFLGILAPLYDDIASYISEFLLKLGLDLGAAFDPATHSWWQLGLYAFSMTMLIMLVLTLFSVFGAIMTFYGYTLSKKGDRYIRRSGLFTKHEVTMRLARLQMIAHKQDWLDRLLKRVNLKFEQSNAHMQNLDAASINNKIIVPSVLPEQAQDLVYELYPDSQFNKIEYQGISKRYLLRSMAYILLPLFLLASLMILLLGKYQALLVLLPVYLLANVIVFMRWKRWGYAIDKNYIYIRRGIFGFDQFCFPRYKVQQTCFKQSVFMKRHELCSVKLVLAAGGMTVPFLPEQQGLALIDSCLFDVEASGKSWM